MLRTDLTDAAWELVKPLLPVARHGGRPRTTDVRAVVNAIFYLLRTGCQWRLLPHQFPPWGTVYHYFRSWEDSGTWVQLHRAFYEQARIARGRAACPSVVIMDGQSVKTTERGGTRGFDGYKRVKGRKRHILSGLSPLFPRIQTIIADAGHESRKLASELCRENGWKLQIAKRRQRAFQITGLTWIVERSFAWLGRNRRFTKDYEYRVQTSETLLDIAATRLMLNRLAPA
jgi:putative transposase